MLSRVESGKRATNTIEIATYTGVCGVTGDEQQALLDLVNEPDDYRIKPRAGKVPDELQTLIFLESTATAIQMFEPIFIPGITQTPEYARALFENSGRGDAADIDGWVALRMQRRSVLTRVGPALCSLYVHENALRMMVASPKVMVEQLLHLLFVSDRPQCSIRVVPASAGLRGSAPGGFQIFSYDEGPALVYLEHRTTSDFLESEEDLDVYQAVLNRLATVALGGAQSREFLVNLASEYEQQGVAQHEDRAGEPEELAQE